MANQLKRFFHCPKFAISVFHEKIQNRLGCKKEISKGCYTVLWTRGFEELEMRTTWSDDSRGRTPMYLRDLVQVLWEPISVLENTPDFIFSTVDKPLRTDGAAFRLSLMQTKRFQGISKSVQQRVFSCKDDNVISKDYESSTSFVCLFIVYWSAELFPTRTGATLTSYPFVL